MRTSLLLLLAIFLGIALAPVSPVLGAACAPMPTCQGCCADSAMDCCQSADSRPAETPLAPTPSTDPAKLLAAPALPFLYLSPLPPAERPAVARTFAARLPVSAPLARTCILLI